MMHYVSSELLPMQEPEWSNFTVDWENGVIRFNLGFDNPYGLSLKAIVSFKQIILRAKAT